MGKRELIALLSLSSRCLVIMGLSAVFVIVVFPEHIVRPGNGRWACQTKHCHSLSI